MGLEPTILRILCVLVSRLTNSANADPSRCLIPGTYVDSWSHIFNKLCDFWLFNNYQLQA